MMMPILDPNPAHHLHGYGHQTFYHQQHIPEQIGKMQLTLILPNGVPSVISVDANTPMMDLLVQAASSNKLNPSNYSLVVLDSNQHIIHFKANQTVGQIGSSTISLLPKEATHTNLSTKPKTQPFEITVRLQVNLPDGQKILLRIDPTLPLYEIKEQICKQKKYTDSNRYTLRLPTKLGCPLLLGLSLAEYKTNVLTLVHLQADANDTNNQLQSYDRLYGVRSESQSAKENVPEVQNEQQESTTNKQRPASVPLNSARSPTRGQNVSSLPVRSTRPVTSHTSLHAYWNDPNFDTQSQTSNCSSTTKKRRAPVAPGYVSPTLNQQQTITPQSPIHHQSHESLTESINGTKQKRKAPVASGPSTPQENQTSETGDNQQIQTTNVEERKITIKMSPADEKRLLNLLAEQQTPITSTLIVTANATEESRAETHSPTPITSTLVVTTNTTEESHAETHSPTPIYSQIQKVAKETLQTESPYSTVQAPSTTPIPEQQQQQQPEQEEKTEVARTSSTNYSVGEIVQAGIAEPPPVVVSPKRKSKESSPMNGLTKIVRDHNERAEAYQKSEKQADNVSYFRVAKSRYGKFETDSQGFVNDATNIFESASNHQEKSIPSSPSLSSSQQQQTMKTSETTTVRKPIPVTVQQQTKGKQAYDLLKKYEKEEENQESQIIDTDYLKTKVNDKEKSPTPPIQLEVTERTTHISVTVESDRKQIITRASPVPQQTSTSPSILTPKPFGKTITEYRTVRRIGNDGETTTTTTVHTQTIPPTNTNTNEAASNDNNTDQANSTSTKQQELSTESTQQNVGSENSAKN